MVAFKPLAGVVAGVAALSVAAFVMLSNASPYVTVAEARSSKLSDMHLQGNLVKESLKIDTAGSLIRFTVVDDQGEKMDVVHHGLPPANMGEATRVVVVGGMKDGHFESHKLLTKCPSKYESDGKPKSAVE